VISVPFYPYERIAVLEGQIIEILITLPLKTQKLHVISTLYFDHYIPTPNLAFLNYFKEA